MNFEQVIHQRWAAAASLEALLPAERVKTVRSFGDAMPYATLIRQKTHPVLTTNAGDSLEDVTLRIDVWHDRFDEAGAIVGEIRAVFDRAAFPLEGDVRVVTMRRVVESMEQDEEGIWRFTVTFAVRVYLAGAS